MAVWIVKAGRMGEREQRDLEHGVVAMGWEELGDLSGVASREELRELYKRTYPESVEGRIANHVGQIWAFLRKIRVGDLVVTPIKTRSEIAVGTIQSDYQFTNQYGPDMQHVRNVKWTQTDVPRTAFDQDLLYTFGAFMTVCQATQPDAETRIRAAVGQGPRPQTADAIETAPLDLEEAARDQIMAYIEQRYKGHGLASLVEGVLQAQGYVTKASPPGPDGGVDILAGKGPIGLDSPRVCVQVKSGRVDADVYRSLRGTIQAFGAEQGLLVGWGGFTQAARREAATSYFAVRLWEKTDLIDAILRDYDHLLPGVQADLPLKRMWRLGLPEDEA